MERQLKKIILYIMIKTQSLFISPKSSDGNSNPSLLALAHVKVGAAISEPPGHIWFRGWHLVRAGTTFFPIKIWDWNAMMPALIWLSSWIRGAGHQITITKKPVLQQRE